MTAVALPGPTDRCPCLSGEMYAGCCGPLHRGDTHATTAERLMRSRYSAFVTDDAAYLLSTWHPRTRPATLELDTSRRWLGLEVLRTVRGGMLHTDGIVEFVARFSDAGRRGEQREVSAFRRVERRWRYVGPAGETSPRV